MAILQNYISKLLYASILSEIDKLVFRFIDKS